MAKQISQIHQKRTPIRRHFIKEWAEARNMRQVDVATEMEIEKSQVSRWFAGQLPQPVYQERLAALFEIAPEALLRHPDDDWLAHFFMGRAAEERERIKRSMEIAFPRPLTGTGE